MPARWDWWHLQHKKVPDPEVVVMARVAEDGDSLGTVEYIKERSAAVCREGRASDDSPGFDTIVVIGDEAQRAGRTYESYR